MKKIVLMVCIIGMLANISVARDKIPLILKNLPENAEELRQAETSILAPLSVKDGKTYVDIFIRGNVPSNQLENLNCRIGSTLGEYTTLHVPVENLTQIASLPDVVQIYPSYRDEPLLDGSTSNQKNGDLFAGCNADSVQAFDMDGTGVIVGVIDLSPLNWKHEDFYTTSWTDDDLRVINIWNQNDNTGPNPTGFTYGTEYSKAELNADNGPATSGGSHGTLCAGIAAGDGSASSGGTRVGMAPGADIIYVHKANGTSFTQDALSYIQQKANALNKPVIISMSIGTTFGHPDGSETICSSINSFCSTGRAMAIAGGNSHGNAHFATGTTTFGSPTNDIKFQISGSYTSSTDLVISRFYYNFGDDFDVTVTDPSSNTYNLVPAPDDSIFDTPDGKCYVFHDTTDVGTPYVEVTITEDYGTITAGDIWTIGFEVPDESKDDQGGNWWALVEGSGFTGTFQTYTFGAPSLNIYATAEECIAVAGHDKTSGNLYPSSSGGYPNIDKPEISSPTNASAPTNDNSASYSTLCCTSGACPHAAGAIALLLQTDPDATPTEIQSYLTNSAYLDAQTESYGTEPNDRFGYGKLNTKGAYDLIPYNFTEEVSGTGTYTFTEVITIAELNFISEDIDNVNVTKHPGENPPNMPGGTKAINNWFSIVANGGTGSFNCNLTLYYTDSELSASGLSEGNLELYRYDGGWQRMGGTNDTGNNSVTLNGVTQFSDWAIADPADNPLPVELKTFYAKVEKGGIQIYWETESEINNAGFYLLRSEDNLKFNSISPLIPGAGTTNETQYYNFVDKNIREGKLYYYKLIDVAMDTNVRNEHAPIAVIANQGQVDLDTPPIPTTYNLEQNFPNPFNPETTIRFQIPDVSHVELSIYDITGKLVKTLVNGEKDAGYHSIIWRGTDADGKPVSSGTYLYKMVTEAYRETRRLMLLK